MLIHYAGFVSRVTSAADPSLSRAAAPEAPRTGTSAFGMAVAGLKQHAIMLSSRSLTGVTSWRSLGSHLVRSRSLSGVSGVGSRAVIFGGFGFTQRQLRKHEEIYREHGFECTPVLSSIQQLITPKIANERGAELAVELQKSDSPICIHTVSGSFWTALYTLAHCDADWRERCVRAIMFDSCPPKSDVAAFGGWLSWFLQAKTKLPAKQTKPIVSQLFHPVRPLFGIDAAWTTANDARMYGDEDRGRRARELPVREGRNSAECVAFAEEAAALASANTGDDTGCVVPRSAACLFVRGRNDPVLEPQYVDAYYAFLKARTTASVELRLFEKAQHAMAVVEAPGQYKAHHVESLLSQVPDFLSPPTSAA